MSNWRNIYKDDKYVKEEIVTAWEWIAQRHSIEEWEGFIHGLTIMLLNCNDSVRESVTAVVHEAATRRHLQGCDHEQGNN